MISVIQQPFGAVKLSITLVIQTHRTLISFRSGASSPKAIFLLLSPRVLFV